MIKKWLENEINGYEKGEDVTQYRDLKANIVGDYIGGRVKCSGKDIPIKPEYIEEYSKVIITSPVSHHF